ncbi:MAG TPA: zinc-dependent alcohol dehydrogenase family protein [Atribacter sp.]|jgi:D-arabinitol dehydrogenase (NADP+)|uniref:zinc-dependent alcohol dehydrogenase family protein n=1 Tax=Atribacter sp. TaxID=2847780 RepID=UPI002BC739CB|nr:zinc-dependent alcohol dehydrogenase family protein [Atribacter sp.]HQK83112.1 zinc-dependent alcohol dehydrogenase family protein [Atribacter sp.]
MKACLFEAKEKYVICDIEKPVPQKDEVLIRVKAVGICGTDIHILKGEYFSDFPLIAGHEFSGEVVEVGEEVTQFQPGDRVTADPNIFCDKCYFCKINKNNHCLDSHVVGVTQNGAFAEYVAVSEKGIFSIPDHLSYSEAALAEPLACVVYGIRRSGIKPGEKVLIFGAGAIGLLLMSLLKMNGASQVVMVDISQKKLDFAKKMGASEVILNNEDGEKKLKAIAPFGFELVADATGSPRVMERELQFVEPDGTFLVFGVAPIGAMMKVEPYDIFRRDIRIIGSYAVKKTMQYSINLLASGKIQVKNLISSTHPLEDFEKGILDFYHDPDHMKIQIIP